MYTEFAYLYPPRPEVRIPQNLLKFYESKGYIAQYKKNGTCTVVFVSPDKQVKFMTRHNEDHKAWAPTKSMIDNFSRLLNNGWNVFAGELLHSKGPEVKNTLYLFDAMVIDGEYLTGVPFKDRYGKMISSFSPTNVESYSHSLVTSDLWIAKNFEHNHKSRFLAINNSLDEGLVLKDPEAILIGCYKPSSNSHGQVKCRVPHANYTF